MPNANSLIARDLLRHQVGVLRVGAETARRAIALLNEVDRDLLERISRIQLSGRRSSLEARLAEIRRLNVAAHTRLGRFMRKELLEIGKHERDYQINLFIKTLPIEWTWNRISVEQIEALVSDAPFAGRLLDEWVSSLEQDKFKRIRDAIRVGVAEGQSIPGIVQRIVGTKKQRYKDSILEIPRRHAEAVVITSVNYIANVARLKLYEENDDIIKAVQWLSTLDDSTTIICIERDGNVYRLKQPHPSPPAHVRCRSTLVPILRSYRELGLDIDEASVGTRASMDGAVPATLRAKDWLLDMPRARVEAILGKKLTIKFYEDPKAPLIRDAAARPMTLQELRIWDAKN